MKISLGKNKNDSVTFTDMKQSINKGVNSLSVATGKMDKKEQKKRSLEKSSDSNDTIFYIDFEGDKNASNASYLKESVSTIIHYQNRYPEQNITVAIRITSPGGEVTKYGYTSSLIDSLRSNNIKTIALIDTVAASGGYMMASSCDIIIANPLSYVGSVGVVAEFPNFHELFEQIGVQWVEKTAGNSKRSLGVFSEMTKEKEDTFNEQINIIHNAFIEHVLKTRKDANSEVFSTGKVFLGSEALNHGLVDYIGNSEDFLINCEEYINCENDDYKLIKVNFPKKDSTSKLFDLAMNVLSKVKINFK